MNRFLSSFIVILILMSCAATKKVKAPPPVPEEPVWTRFQTVKGEWYDEKRKLYETWKNDGQFTLKGELFAIDVAGNNRTQEHNRFMYATDTVITLERRVIVQNMATSSRMRMASAKGHVFKFQNTMEAWPQYITYEVRMPDTLIVSHSNGRDKTLTFNYLRATAK
jgi:hypothetical protein